MIKDMLEESASHFTKVSDLGEFGLINQITKDFSISNENVLMGVGDDAAVYKSGENEVSILSTDLLIEGVHFDLAYVPLKHLGYKAVAVNVSDICAMNGSAVGITVSIGLSNRFTVEAVEEIYSGIKAACTFYKIDLLGGDTSSSKTGLILSISVIGKAENGKVVYRNGAKEKDLICVSGDLGSAYAGLQVLEREKIVYQSQPEMQPDLASYPYVVERQLKPEARIDIIEKFKELGIQPTSMIDISDGIASDLHHICRNSGTGAHIYLNKIPIDPETIRVAEEFSIDSNTFALYGGEDYELLFTIPLKDFDKIKDWDQISIIGTIKDKSEGVQVITASGQMVDLVPSGFQHFTPGVS